MEKSSQIQAREQEEGGEVLKDRKERLYRICRWEIELWEHILNGCSRGKGYSGDRVREILE